MPKLEENQLETAFFSKRNILIREDLEYTAGKLFTYATISLATITVYASLTFLVIQQLKK